MVPWKQTGKTIKITLYFIRLRLQSQATAWPPKWPQATSIWDWRLVWGHLGTVQGGALKQEEEERPSVWDKRGE